MPVATTTLVRYYEATVTQQNVELSFVGGKQFFGLDALLEPIPVHRATAMAAPFAATFVSFPWTPPGAEGHWWQAPMEVADTLGLGLHGGEQPGRVTWPVLVAHVLTGGADVRAFIHPSGVRAFADRLVDEPVIPIEESPLSGASLAELLSRAPHAAGAVVAAWATGPDQTLLLLVTMPTGMVVFGAASGVASAMNTGLRAKILGWMGVPDPLQPPAPINEPPVDEPGA